MSKRVVVFTEAQADIAALDRPMALRISKAIHRFAATGAGNVQGLHGIHPPSSGSASATGAFAFMTTAIGSMSCACGNARWRTGEASASLSVGGQDATAPCLFGL